VAGRRQLAAGHILQGLRAFRSQGEWGENKTQLRGSLGAPTASLLAAHLPACLLQACDTSARPLPPPNLNLPSPCACHACPPASQINFLLLTSLGVLLPMRLHLPLHLAFPLLMLRATAQRCHAECEMPYGTVEALGGSPAFQPYYEAAVWWLRRLNPRALWRLPAHWRPAGATAGGCLGSCFASHAFLQVCGGDQQGRAGG